jgi:hypothetical protein
MPLGPARDRDAVAAIAPENFQDLLRLRPAEQLLEPRDVFETQFQGLRALVGVAQDCRALHPIALLLEIQKSAQTGGARRASRAQISSHGSNPTLRLEMASRLCRCTTALPGSLSLTLGGFVIARQAFQDCWSYQHATLRRRHGRSDAG